MTEPEIFGRVLQHMQEYLEADLSYLTLDSRLPTSIDGLDSLRLFEMLLYLEDQLHISVDESVTDSLETMGNLVSYIGRQLAITGKTPA